MAKAGVSYTVGREATAQYGETLNGVQTKNSHSHQFTAPVDPYVKPGDPKSGLLPGLHAGSPGEEGGPDKLVQAYCYRLCMTDDTRRIATGRLLKAISPLRITCWARSIRSSTWRFGGGRAWCPMCWVPATRPGQPTRRSSAFSTKSAHDRRPRAPRPSRRGMPSRPKMTTRRSASCFRRTSD